MGKIFSDEVEQGLKYVCYEERLGKGKEGMALLEKASAAGDGDASCILARCFWGGQYIWAGHGFPVDDKRGDSLMRQSVKQGSALGVLCALRSRLLTPALEKNLPFESLEDAFNVVKEKAEAGDAFCQYTVGNMYFWMDFVRIFGKGRDAFPSQDAYNEYLKENILKCEPWFKRAFEGGMWLAGNNLRNFYLEGDKNLIPPRPELAEGIFEHGAELGYPVHQRFAADHLSEAGDHEGAFKWYKASAEGGEKVSQFHLAKHYELGQGTEKDVHKAVEWYEKYLEDGPDTPGCNRLGGILYEGPDGIEPDYGRSFQLLSYAWNQGNTWGADCLGRMYFYGRGTQQDYVKAREILEKVDYNNKEVWYCLGCIYAGGLGVAEDIPKGVALLQKAGDYAPAKQELLKYKKTLLGKWVRRK